MRICVVGLGKLGMPLAAVLADSGHDVIGADSRLLDPAELEGLAEPVYLGKAQAAATAGALTRRT